MRIFDTHTHVYPDAVALRVVEYLKEKSSNLPAYTNGQAADLRAKALAAGYTGWLNCPIATAPRQVDSINAWAKELSHWPHISMGTIHPEVENLLQTLEKIQESGLFGVKLHPEYQDFHLLEDRMTPIWEYCSANQFPVIVHAGHDIGFPGGNHSTPQDFAALGRRYPKLLMICAHMGGWDLWDDVEKYLCDCPFYFDTSFTKQWLADQSQFERIIRKHGTDKILYGSDSPWENLTDGIGYINDLSLPDTEKQKILWDNAAKLFHLAEKCAN